MSSSYESIVKQEQQFFAPGVRRWPLALVRGEGSRVWDLDGSEFVDLTAGWGVTAIGHCHPALVQAIAAQAGRLMQTTNLFYTLPQLDLVERLAALRTPTLVVGGTDDRLTPPRYAEELAKAIPGAELAYIPEAGHLPYLESPELFARVVLSYLKNEAGS